MGAKWFWGIIILAILALLWAMYSAPKRSAAMGDDIRAALHQSGHGDYSVDMDGNVAVLTGTAPSESAANAAADVAANVNCSHCPTKKRWHTVDNQLEFNTLPTVSPYIFQGIKDETGRVVLNGYVASSDHRDHVLAKARSVYSGEVVDETIKLAVGQPDPDWNKVLDINIDALGTLQSGRFVMEDETSFISGRATSTDVRDQINLIVGALPGQYEGAANISVEGSSAQNIGTVKSETICQTLLNDLKSGKKINFAYDKAEIRGAESFDLLNSLASAAQQCSAFMIRVEGHTDSDGAAEYNQRLSEARANTVTAYLSQNGVDINRLKSAGYGEDRPIADNSTSEGMANNRRIEFIVTQSE